MMNNLQVDEKNNKNEKFEKSLKMCIIINFKTVRYKLTALGNIILSFLNYKLLRQQSKHELRHNISKHFSF